MAPQWARDESAVREILSRYPDKRSAIMPLLHLAQEQRGYLDREDIDAVGEILDLTPAQVESVASFYSLFLRRPEGRYTLTVCGNLACALGGARELVGYLERRLGVVAGETTGDGMFTLKVTGECLAACDQAPVLQVNGYYVHRATPERVDALIESLKDGVPPARLADKATLPGEATRAPATPAISPNGQRPVAERKGPGDEPDL
ncbi:MAG: NAD(P)H-dependent oxidoreductase subunit E [Limnochordaceae bacterium]|nr:NAD(P)H-dependent oxidoreductase subunit E [Limnochordaceae bacterium]